ncbi:MAG: OmpA family protein [Calditrichaeota bacterium]|nr:OmpA family protein [Calditrichota bacterium]
MSFKKTLFGGLILFGAFFVLCLVHGANKIETHLKNQTEQKLKKQGFNEVHTAVDGRIVVLQGKLSSKKEKAAAERLVASVWGVRTVVNHIRVQRPASAFSAGVTRFVKEIQQTTVHFAPNRWAISPSNRILLDCLADSLKKYSHMSIRIVGFSDSLGNLARNKIISRKRAEAVRDYFLGKGISSSRLVVEGKGSRDFCASNQTDEGRWKNRRVEFRVLETP